ncbi:MAG: hypothetical protein ABH851_03580 [Methanobacteriota archaeon]
MVDVSREVGCEGRLHLQPRDIASGLFYNNLKFGDEGLKKGRDGFYYLPKALASKFQEHLRDMILMKENL